LDLEKDLLRKTARHRALRMIREGDRVGRGTLRREGLAHLLEAMLLLANVLGRVQRVRLLGRAGKFLRPIDPLAKT
jgi:hypothetical protein